MTFLIIWLSTTIAIALLFYPVIKHFQEKADRREEERIKKYEEDYINQMGWNKDNK